MKTSGHGSPPVDSRSQPKTPAVDGRSQPKTPAEAAAGTADLDSGLVCLLIVGRFHGIAADGDRLRRECGRPGESFRVMELLRAARSLGLKARCVRSRWARRAVPLPALARMRDGRWTILARAEADAVLVQDPARAAARRVRRAFEAVWSGELILLTRRAPHPARPPLWLCVVHPRFIRYRRFLAEVLLASFFLQLFALVAPLFTQVVIDKVLVHKG